MKLNPFSKASRQRRKARQALCQLHQQADHSFVVSYAKNMHSELSHICQKHGTDKGAINAADHPQSRVHNYADFYEVIFDGIRQKVKHVLECGIGHMATGSSLRTWQEYFPNAIITGVDIDESLLFNEERIETYQIDQTDPTSIKQFLEKIKNRKFNIIIDDGLHTAEAGITFFDNMIDNLTNDGIYIIEDVKLVDMVKIVQHQAEHDSNYDVKFINLYRPKKSSLKSLGDNSLVMITKNTKHEIA